MSGRVSYPLCGERSLCSTVESPHIRHAPDPSKPVALRTCSVSGKEFRYMTARPSPQIRGDKAKPVPWRTCPILGCPILRLSTVIAELFHSLPPSSSIFGRRSELHSEHCKGSMY
jgi:hypothetical protein